MNILPLFIYIATFALNIASASTNTVEPVKVIITGHTLAGKTSVINELQKRGYYIVPEAATTILLEEYQKLDKAHPENAPHGLPWQIDNLQMKIFSAQKSAYKQALQECRIHPPKNNLIIFDRSVLDSRVYAKIFYPEGSFTEHETAFFNKCITKALLPGSFAKTVIFSEIVPLEYYNGRLSNSVRHENYEQACFIGEHLRHGYQELGFTLHSVGFAETISQKTDTVEALLLTIAKAHE